MPSGVPFSAGAVTRTRPNRITASSRSGLDPGAPVPPADSTRTIRKINVADAAPTGNRGRRKRRLGRERATARLRRRPAVRPGGGHPRRDAYPDRRLRARASPPAKAPSGSRTRSSDTVSRIDPATNTIVERIPVGDDPIAVAVGDGSVWVTNYLDGTVSRIDPATNEVVQTIEVGLPPRSHRGGRGRRLGDGARAVTRWR